MSFDTQFAQVNYPSDENPAHIIAACGYQSFPEKRYVIMVASSEYVNNGWNNTFTNDFIIEREVIDAEYYAECLGLNRKFSED